MGGSAGVLEIGESVTGMSQSVRQAALVSEGALCSAHTRDPRVSVCQL